MMVYLYACSAREARAMAREAARRV